MSPQRHLPLLSFIYVTIFCLIISNVLWSLEVTSKRFCVEECGVSFVAVVVVVVGGGGGGGGGGGVLFSFWLLLLFVFVC